MNPLFDSNSYGLRSDHNLHVVEMLSFRQCNESQPQILVKVATPKGGSGT